MFHPARLGKYLLMFFLIKGYDAAAVVKNDETVAGCALIEGADVIGHFYFSIGIKGLKYQL